MFNVVQEKHKSYNYLGLFSGAGGLDLGFEKAGFKHIESSDILPCAVETLRVNRPNWSVLNCDVREYSPKYRGDVDVLLGGFPCQGFSLGGNRNPHDERNSLYKEVIRLTKELQPRIVVCENVLNLRTMIHPGTGKKFSDQIAEEFSTIGYKCKYNFFKVCHYGVPQTRRRFIFIAYKDPKFDNFEFPIPEKEIGIKDFLIDLANSKNIILPNHNPVWEFKSTVHIATGAPFDENELAVPVRFSRTASEGKPIRSFEQPFPAVDTATIWGWALGNVKAFRIDKNRTSSDAMYVRNQEATVKLWRISASKLRAFTDREYARLQTFPDDWTFIGENKRDTHLQIGNAVPVIFAKKIAMSVLRALEIADGVRNDDFYLQ